MIDHTHEHSKDVSAAFLIPVEVDSSMTQSVIVGARVHGAEPGADFSPHLERPVDVPTALSSSHAVTARIGRLCIPAHRRSPATPRRPLGPESLELLTHGNAALRAGQVSGRSSSVFAPGARSSGRVPRWARLAPELSCPQLHPNTSHGCRDAHEPTDATQARGACRPNLEGGVPLE